MKLKINKNTKIITSLESSPIQKAMNDLYRDIQKVCLETDESASDIFLNKASYKLAPGCFEISVEQVNNVQSTDTNTIDNSNVYRQPVIENKPLHIIYINASDDLGFVYGLYYISREILGIHDFWFWNDQVTDKKEAYYVSEDYHFQSKSFAIRLRGWFVNDEVLLHKWSLDGDKDKPWEMVFETLLRCGGNMIIPGTDKNKNHYSELACKRGLYISHHHAEPLGAEMFSRAFPSLNPSYDEHPEKFLQLWKEGIENQKHLKVVWNLGFRGQGDCPFWVSDPRYQTSESRGGLMSQLIKKQYDLVKEHDPEALCCSNLYGETMELYCEGYLDLPEDIILIWADNGYGKMVTRRQDNHNPRVVALPTDNNKGTHGIYYHVSFYDLQAANHMTMLHNSPEFVVDELKQVMDLHMDDYWIINCSNVKPHVYYLDLIAKLWQEGSLNIENHRLTYCENYYGLEAKSLISDIIEDYHKNAVAFGIHEDEHAGEQFVNHVPRMLISQFMRNKEKPSKQLFWATDAKDLYGQVQWFKDICHKGMTGYQNYLKECQKTVASLEGNSEVLFRDSLMLQAILLYKCYLGAYKVTESLLAAFEEDYIGAFYLAGKAKESYTQGNQTMRDREHGKWLGFYENDCLTDIKQTAWVLQGLMSYLRNLGDGPHYYEWQREFLYSEEDRKIMLILNMENHLTDEELYPLMKARFEK